jgi:hypothetical protein
MHEMCGSLPKKHNQNNILDKWYAGGLSSNLSIESARAGEVYIIVKQSYLFAPFLFRGFPPQPLPDCPRPLPEPSFFGTPFGTSLPPKSFPSSIELLLFYNLPKKFPFEPLTVKAPTILNVFIGS